MTAGPEASAPPLLSSLEVARLAGISYKQADHWARQGYLHPEHRGGTGNMRLWPAGEAEIARRMARLTAAGLPPELAAQFAREQWPAGELAPGITVSVTE